MIGTYGVHADWSTTHILFVYEPFYISFEGLDTKFRDRHTPIVSSVKGAGNTRRAVGLRRMGA